MIELTNNFFDINKLPRKEGLLIFPISMSRISNSQSGEKYFDFIDKFTAKLSKAVVGASFVYTDNLYAKYHQEPSASRDKYLDLMITHKNLFYKNLRKKSTYIEKAFSFITWSQLVIETTNFFHKIAEVKKFYLKDKDFQKYVKEDINSSGRKVTNDNVDFILEEALMAYLILKEEIYLQNDFVNGRDKWRLLCYPGKPPKSMIYFFQKNIFKLESRNQYQDCHYDLEEKKLYEFNKVDLKKLQL